MSENILHFLIGNPRFSVEKGSEQMEVKPAKSSQRRADGEAVQSSSPQPGVQETLKAVNTTYNLIGTILQVGVILSAGVILIGLFLLSLQPDKFAPQKLNLFPQTFSQVWSRVAGTSSASGDYAWTALADSDPGGTGSSLYSGFCN